MTPAEVLKLAEKHGAKMVDFKFIDLLGIWQHTTMPIGKLEVGTFKDGYFFDGSSIRGWQPIHASDMIFIPDANTAVIDPFLAAAAFEPRIRELGPALAGVFGRPVTDPGCGVLTADEEYVRESIVNPTAVVAAGFAPVMPSFAGRVTDEQLRSLVAYVKSLRAR